MAVKEVASLLSNVYLYVHFLNHSAEYLSHAPNIVLYFHGNILPISSTVLAPNILLLSNANAYECSSEVYYFWGYIITQYQFIYYNLQNVLRQ